MINPLETFFEEQLREWPLAHDNHDALTRVWSRELTSDKLAIPLRVQYNPARIVSTGANIDKASIAARPCFLCAKNRPAEQRAMPLNADFEWLVNPFPILPHHYTIAAKVHRPQRILDAYDAMIQATLALPEEYIVFYNGPKCGASAPDHLHLQAGIFDCQLLTANYPYKILLADSKESFRRIYDSLPVTDGEEEPRMNVIAFRKGNHVSLIVIPRRAHRPHCYTAEGDKHYLISPGALDMGGLIVTPRREDYDRLTADKAIDILCEVGVRTEPTIDVGIMQGKEIEFTLNSPYHLRDSLRQGTFTAHLTGEGIVLDGTTHDSIELTPCDASATFSLHGVTIGKEFHWQQQETQTFQGSLVLRIIEGELHAINRIAIEDYLTSVIASEMSGTSSVELLKAHAIISRSWLLAQIKTASPLPLPRRGDSVIAEPSSPPWEGLGEAPLCLVESEKTALIMSLVCPDKVWLATGGKANFKEQMLWPLLGYEVAVYPDADALHDWAVRIAQLNRELGHRLYIPTGYYNLMDHDEARREGWDLADILLREEGK